jgi:hypothetical protein
MNPITNETTNEIGIHCPITKDREPTFEPRLDARLPTKRPKAFSHMRVNLYHYQPIQSLRDPVTWLRPDTPHSTTMSAVAWTLRRRDGLAVQPILFFPAARYSIGPASILACHADPQPLFGRWQWQGLGLVVPIDGSEHWLILSRRDECLRDGRPSITTYPAPSTKYPISIQERPRCRQSNYTPEAKAGRLRVPAVMAKTFRRLRSARYKPPTQRICAAWVRSRSSE